LKWPQAEKAGGQTLWGRRGEEGEEGGGGEEGG
jgi:hypothetical protein